jgi:hypothetical protein
MPAAALAAALVAGCLTNPCKQGTLLLTVTIEGGATSANELRVDVTTEGQAPRSKTFGRQPGSGGGTIQIDYPEGYETGKMSMVVVTATDTTSGAKLAEATANLMLADTCSTAIVALRAPGGPTGTAGAGGGGSGTGGRGGGGGSATGGRGGAGGSAPACSAGTSCTIASADPCAVYTIDCSTGAPVCQRSGLKPAGMSCPTGVCSQAGTCVACQNGADCTPASAPCKVGTLACATGTPVCNAGTTNRSDGTPCGMNRVCSAGACTECVANQPCTPPAGVCVYGTTTCGSGTSVCQPTTPVAAGQGCGSNMVCNGSGSCVSCQQGATCTPTVNNCRTGALNCSTGTPMCAETTTPLADGLYCAVDKLCAAGACAPAGNWITRGEDQWTATGGSVYSVAFNGATCTPMSSWNVPFTPSAGGVTGKALAVTLTVPAEDPPNNVFPGAGLGIVLTPNQTSLNVAVRGSGIQFQVRSTRPVVLRMLAMDIWTDQPFMNCSESTASNVVHRCYQYPQTTCTVPVADVWTQCRAPWSAFKRPLWGNMGDNLPLDTSAMTNFQILAPPTPMGTATQTWVYAVDDVAFTP